MASPLKVTLSGIDGSGKSTSASALSRRLAAEGLVVVHPLRRAYVDRPGEPREYFADALHSLVDRSHRGLDRLGSRAGVGLINVLYARIWSRVEAWAVARYQPDVVLSGRSALLDPAVYAPFYFRATRALAPRRRIVWSRLVGGATPADLEFLLDVPAGTAHRRILERIARERADGADEREKWTHMHETEPELARLAAEFERCAREMPTTVLRVDARRPREQVIEQLLGEIRAARAASSGS